MQLSQYYQENDNQIIIQPEQASQFAKHVANDFNPIHDPDHQRFCVPGDLLFAIVLEKYGLSQRMEFEFTGMVSKPVPLIFPEINESEFSISDDAEKDYLRVKRDGDVTRDQDLIEDMTCRYVAFSGKNFPDLIVPLMQEHDVMIHPDRPLVVYESMSFDLETVTFDEIHLELSGTQLDVMGKKGKATLAFTMRDGSGNVIGSGSKRLALRGLVSYEQSAIDAMVNLYEERRTKMAA